MPPPDSITDLRIHFYYVGQRSIEKISFWNPVADPMQFPNSEGHAFFQLMLKLRAQGVNISIGKEIPENTRIIVVFKKARLRLLNQLTLLKSLLASQYRIPLVLIAADCESGRANTFMHHVEIVANRSQEIGKSDIFIPLLPQNALIKRPSGFWDGTVGLYGHSKNFPSHLLDAEFMEKLEQRNIKLKVVMTDSEYKEKMIDFSGICISLCIRSSQEQGAGRKPPTKLVNAWNAEVIPIIDREPGYLSIATPGEDCVLLKTDHVRETIQAKKELLRILEELQDYANAKPLLENIHQRSIDYSESSILNKYIELFKKINPTRPNDIQNRLVLIFAFLTRFVFIIYRKCENYIKKFRLDLNRLEH
jgi:hypothetical protein